MLLTKVAEKLETHILCSTTFFFLESFRVDIMRKIIVERGRPQMTIWRMRIACWIPATNTHTDYVTLVAFPLQQWLNERASWLRFTYISCLV